MGTLAMRLAAPMQSWGVAGRFNERTTGSVPSKSGIVGLIAAALGRRRTEDISDIAAWKLAIRIDCPGKMGRDFQTARTRKYDTQTQLWQPNGNPYVSRRYYLMGASFVAAVEMPDDMLDVVADALDHPAFPLYLGRRSCPPACRILIGTYPGENAMSVLTRIPYDEGNGRKSNYAREARNERLRLDIVRDEADIRKDADVPHESVHDYPLSFSPAHRQFAWRTVVYDHVLVGDEDKGSPEEAATSPSHDPMAAVMIAQEDRDAISQQTENQREEA